MAERKRVSHDRPFAYDDLDAVVILRAWRSDLDGVVGSRVDSPANAPPGSTFGNVARQCLGPSHLRVRSSAP